MRAINYLKLDIRIVRGTLKFLVLAPLLFIVLSLKESSVMGLGYMFFFLIVVAATPFSAESNEKCDRMYYMLPSKISSMVLGRFLFLISAVLSVWIVDGSILTYYYRTNPLGILETMAICVTGVAATLICICQYPVYYKFGMEKGNMISIIFYMLPAFSIFALPSVLKKNSFFTPQFLNSIITSVNANKIPILILSAVIISITGIISYLISCWICEKKEI